MPAVLEDPTGPAFYRSSGLPPYPSPNSPLPHEIQARQVTLRDRVTIATLIPFSSPHQIPHSLLAYLCDQLNREIEKGDTYPMIEPLSLPQFGPYWFANFGAVMLLGSLTSANDLPLLESQGIDWTKQCLGSFYIKPNYPGRSSHICNGGFLVTDAARNRGVGRLMGEAYLDWAPKLGYTYSVFNLVYETNTASCRIWDALGFKRIGRIKGCGNLRSHPDGFVDAIIYGRELGPEGEDFVSEERFDKIRYYLKNGKYPNGAGRAEKSRLRSAATHYKLKDTPEGEKLMLRDKEVVADPQRQYEIARGVHVENHGGINKTTATIAEKYHWVRIKETVSLVIKNCAECKELAKAPVVRADGIPSTPNHDPHAHSHSPFNNPPHPHSAAGRVLSIPHNTAHHIPSPLESTPTEHPMTAPIAKMHIPPPPDDYADLPLDPQIMDDVRHNFPPYQPLSSDPHVDHFATPNGPHDHYGSVVDDGAGTGGPVDNNDYEALLNTHTHAESPSPDLGGVVPVSHNHHHAHTGSAHGHHHPDDADADADADADDTLESAMSDAVRAMNSAMQMHQHAHIQHTTQSPHHQTHTPPNANHSHPHLQTSSAAAAAAAAAAALFGSHFDDGDFSGMVHDEDDDEDESEDLDAEGEADGDVDVGDIDGDQGRFKRQRVG